MLEVLRLFRGRDALRLSRMDPYLRTHPVWSERIALIEERAATLRRGDGPTVEDVYWHARMVAKLDGFLDEPRRTLRRTSADGSEVATLARAVANHRLPDVSSSLALVDSLIAMRPDDAFYHELKGQFLLESGRAGPAAASYRRAVELAPFEPLILGGLGRALLNTNDDPCLRKRETNSRFRRASTGPIPASCAIWRWPRRARATRARPRWRRPSATP